MNTLSVIEMTFKCIKLPEDRYEKPRTYGWRNMLYCSVQRSFQTPKSKTSCTKTMILTHSDTDTRK